MKKLICSNCNSEYNGYKDKRTINNFCSKSCAATFNNKKFPKRAMINTCRECGIKIPSQDTFCKPCWNSSPDIIIKTKNKTGIKKINRVTMDRTIGSMLCIDSLANKYSRIRDHARRMVKHREQICVVCGYDKHVECCHVKDISKFSETQLLSEVNADENLVLLCKNCHWEFDHDLMDEHNKICILSIGQVGIEPTYTPL